ncbi:MAG: CapA family protein [Clostridia bacterium]|nr:CapA family protein [Clostridia bacterium]
MKTLLLGDLSPTQVTEPFFQNGDTQALLSDAVSLFDGNDFILVNLECALTDCEQEIKKIGPALKSGKGTATTLKKLNVDCCGLSNNHIFDFGKKGVQDTIEALSDVGIAYTGFGDSYEDSRKNHIVKKDGERVCVIAVCEHEYSFALPDRMGSRPFDEYNTIEDIRAAKVENDRVIVTYHGGKEYCRYPSPRLHKACRAMIRAGADVVLCQHSHCIGCYEEYEGGHILYGQGNFHFVKPAGINTPEGWESSLAVKYDTKTNEIEFIPMVTYENKGMTLAKGEEKDNILKAFEARNAELANGEWEAKWHEFCLSDKDFYFDVIKNACKPDSTELDLQFFAACLTCEAHTDMWRGLIKTWNHTNEK